MLLQRDRGTRLRWVAALTFCALGAVRPAAATELQAIREACNTITAGELKRHVDVLADDSFEGRQAGSRGGHAAGGYLVQFFEQSGLLGAGVDGSYYQPFGNGCRNILGMIRGSDPELQNQVILIGAHYDHVGYGNRRNSFGPTGFIHNGADDNASGTAALMELVQAFANLSEPPRRTIVFAAWDGEEMGLLGSKHWTTHPSIDLSSIQLAINLDMVGRLRDRRVEIYGVRTSWGLRQLVSRQNSASDALLNLDFIWDIKENSDHYSFFTHSIPILMFHTGLHDDYHRPRDDAEKINSDGIQLVAQLTFYVALEAADRDAGLAFRSDSRYESDVARNQYEGPVPGGPPRLGVSWAANDQDGGLLISQVTVGSPADMAGLRVGDRIVQFQEWTIEDDQHFPLLVLAADSLAQVTIERPGEPEPISLPVHLAGTPVRVGIKWREDAADPGSVLLTNIVPGSAAGLAQLQQRDRVYAVNGRRFSGSQEFHRLVTTCNGPIELLVERNGQLRPATLKSWDVAASEQVKVTPPPSTE